MNPFDQIPMKWPAGPFWETPASLDLLRGTPINTLVLDKHPAGADFVQACRSREIQIHDPADTAILITDKGKWPQIQGGANASAGPTGPPWVDANGWAIALERALEPEKVLWLSYSPPEKTVLRPALYQLAVADAAAFDARWIVALDASLTAGLAEGKPASINCLKTIASTLNYFEKRKATHSVQPAARLAVVCDFAGKNEYMGEEALNLLARRQVPYRVVLKANFAKAPLDGLAGILYIDEDPAPPQIASRLAQFAQAGGTAILTTRDPNLTRKIKADDSEPRFNVYPAGKGRIAVPKEKVDDPFLLAIDAHMILSRKNDVIRLFNAGTMAVTYGRMPGNRGFVQVINYEPRPMWIPAVVGVLDRYARATITTLDKPDPAPLKIVNAPRGIELRLPNALSAYAAIELEN